MKTPVRLSAATGANNTQTHRQRSSSFTRSTKGGATMVSHGTSPAASLLSVPAPAQATRKTASPLFRTQIHTTGIAAVFACCCFLMAPLEAEGFLRPSVASAAYAHRLQATVSRTTFAAKGFSKNEEPPPPSPAAGGVAGAGAGGASASSGAGGGGGVESWEKEYKAYIKRTGQHICSMSWEGHENMGRGAIFANYDDARKEGKLNEADKFGGIPSMYVPLTEFESRRTAGEQAGEGGDLAQILKRVKGYSPEKEFVVVFQACGVMGADIVRPNISPPEMAKRVVKSDGVSTLPSATGLDGVVDV